MYLELVISHAYISHSSRISLHRIQNRTIIVLRYKEYEIELLYGIYIFILFLFNINMNFDY